jgi:hypothetical protein
LPEEFLGISAYVYPLVPIPILTHEWTTSSKGLYVLWEVKVGNVGTATANDVYVYAGFDAGNNQVWNPEQSTPTNLEADYILTVQLYLIVPLHKHTRLVVRIMMDGYTVNKSYSEWFDT